MFEGSCDSVNFDRAGSFFKNIQAAINDFKKAESQFENWDEDDEPFVDINDEIDGEPVEVSYGDESPEQEEYRERTDVDETISLDNEDETGLKADVQKESAPVKAMANVEVMNAVELETPASMPSFSSNSPVRSEDVFRAFQGLKVTMNAEGDMQLTAKGDSAKLLAGLFRGLAQALDP